MTEKLLSVVDLAGGYPGIDVLFNVQMEIAAGQAVALCGRNGMGKTSTIRAIIGQLLIHGGDVSFEGRSLRGSTPNVIARCGIGLVPEGRHLFPSLSVEENLTVLARYNPNRKTNWTKQRVLELFPQIRNLLGRPASHTSGGEQQMIAIGRALMTNPRLLILDEATEGLAPLVRKEIWHTLRRLKDEGESILVVDKDLAALAQFVDACYVLERGRTVWCGSGEELTRERSNVEKLLTV